MDVYTKEGETPRLVRTPAQRVAAEFDGFKPAEDSQPESDETMRDGQTLEQHLARRDAELTAQALSQPANSPTSLPYLAGE